MTSFRNLTILLLCYSSLAHSQDGRLTNPVLDAKQAFQQGKLEFVGIQLTEELLLPGIKPLQQDTIRKNYTIRALNRRWKTLENSEQDPKRLHQLKRYANRYNLTIHKLIKQEKLEHARRYRY